MKIPNESIDHIQQFVPFDLTTSIGCTMMAHDMSNCLNASISPNTLKRAFGIIHSSSATSKYTLDLIARYVGYSSWENFNDEKPSKSSTFNNLNVLSLDTIAIGQSVKFSYSPNRVVTMKCIDRQKFCITKSLNSKIIEGDIVIANQIIARHPFHILSVVRNNSNLGSFTAGIHEGIESIELI